MILAIVLAGLYAQDCKMGLRKSQNFTAVESIYTEANFSDVNCTKPALTSRSYGSYTLGEALLEPAGASAIDFIFRRVTLTPETAAVAENFRVRALCGLTSWQAGVENEVTGLDCDLVATGTLFPVPSVGSARFGAVKSAGEGLYFGRLLPGQDASSPALRPRTLDPAPYKKAP